MGNFSFEFFQVLDTLRIVPRRLEDPKAFEYSTELFWQLHPEFWLSGHSNH